MDHPLFDAGMRLLAATLAGGIIGLERAYNGREAGFRTHILVAIASALLMLLLEFQWLSTPSERLDAIRVDPTRMAQGIMTGIGFLGAGVILHHRHSVRGLTTAASIWITSAIGIMLGSGYYGIGALATLLVLLTLSVFRSFEHHIPTRRYARLSITAKENLEVIEDRLRRMLGDQGIKSNGFAYHFQSQGRELELQTTISTFNSQKFGQLERGLLELSELSAFHITPLDN